MNSLEKIRPSDSIEVENAARVIRALFSTNALWRCYSIKVSKIVETVRAIDSYPYDEVVVRRALTGLVREKFLRSRVDCGERLYEANLSTEDFASGSAK